MVRFRLDTWSRRKRLDLQAGVEQNLQVVEQHHVAGCGGDHFLQQPLDLPGPLRAGQFEHPLAQFQVDVHEWAAELLRHGLQGGGLAGARQHPPG